MFDFTDDIKRKLKRADHGEWFEYILEFQGYKLHIQMPTKNENTIELFVNEGKKELIGGIILQPKEYNSLVNLLENGGIYIQQKNGLIRKTKHVYLKGIYPDIIPDRITNKVY